jgi:AcrR family transcriptional regulator
MSINTKRITESGFVKAFIGEYFEDRFYSYYHDKDRLMYALCKSEVEKIELTRNLVEQIKADIKKLGFEDLSFAYLSTSNPQSFEYLEWDKRLKFWIDRFAEEFTDRFNVFNPITKACLLFNNAKDINIECFENETDFWVFYPKSLWPIHTDLSYIVICEQELLCLIDFDIDEFENNDFWEFEFDEYQHYYEFSKPIQSLFDLCELLVQLCRFDGFSETLVSTELNKASINNKTVKAFATVAAPVIALFCQLVNEAKIIVRGNDESNERYCMRVCDAYKLKYTDRVRQGYGGNKSRKHYEKVKSDILTQVDADTRNAVQIIIDSKHPQSKNLYG